MRFSNNHFVKEEYEKIRYQIADLLRQLELFRLQAEAAGEDIGLLSFDVFKVKLKEQDQQMNADIDGLIREHKITPEAGTSLINDSAYMYEIKKHLVDMAETVFVIQQQKTTTSERELALDDSELIKVMHSDS